MKKIILFLILIIQSLLVLAQNNLNVFLDENRFLTSQGYTQLEINYAVPYYSLDFTRSKYGYDAELFVDISVKKDGRLVSNDSFTNRVIIRDGARIYSDDEYLDKIVITLPASEFEVEIDLTDIRTERSYRWQKEITPLRENALASDLELSSYVERDTTRYLEKFHRGDLLYYVQPGKTFMSNSERIYIYQEFYNLFADDKGDFILEMNLKIYRKNALIDSLQYSFSGKQQSKNSVTQYLDISGYEDGYYTLEVRSKDIISGIEAFANDYFLIKTRKSSLRRFFPDLEDDFLLAGYFFNTNQVKVWKTLTLEGKKNYLEKFWKSQDPNPATEENEFLQEIEERLKFVNANFTHFREGWTTDRGRIYLKYGQPYEITKHTTALGTNRFSEYSEYNTEENQNALFTMHTTVKEYEIWKYRMKKDANYIFIDTITSGNYKLIYSSDDNDGESSLPDWRSYLGYDFDERLLD